MPAPLIALALAVRLVGLAGAPPMPPDIAAAVVDSRAHLLRMQESFANNPSRAEWPYEGVYRVRRQIPYGYRVGGTAIVARTLLEAPGYLTDNERIEAVHRACDFIIDAINEPLMSPDPKLYKGGYDVRGWGHCYGLRFLLALERINAVPAERAAKVELAIRWYLHALQSTEIPQTGGWNYARKPGLEVPCGSSPFMTSPCVMALYEAKSNGHAIDEAVLDRALALLERSRGTSGYVDYSTMERHPDQPEQIPGGIGRMVAAESALFLAGRSDTGRVRTAIEAFLTHWPELEARRRKNGTHEPPYGVAPYYFFYGFHHAALAIELLPDDERGPHRDRLNRILFSVREHDLTWNDRVFPRSANFGTAMTMSGLLMPWGPRPIGREAMEPNA
ncbi:MAG: hypothetical protein SGJ11_03800 [Phycisphaerae bacterium]|nr:hypothetical protein [Phycisphaerae bacterium]